MEKIVEENNILKIKIKQLEIANKLDYEKIEKLKKELKELKKICSVYNINV